MKKLEMARFVMNVLVTVFEWAMTMAYVAMIGVYLLEGNKGMWDAGLLWCGAAALLGVLALVSVWVYCDLEDAIFYAELNL